VPAKCSGVIYALGGMAGGLVLYMERGYLHYEYNSLGLARTKLRGIKRITAGPHRIELETVRSGPAPGAPATFVMRADGMELARGTTPFTAPLCFTASESFDVGVDLGTPVSLDYADRSPFAFEGHISDVHIVYTA
jgi:arylsulfatase